MINGETMAESTAESLYKRYESLPLAQQIALGVAPGTGEVISAYETPKFAGEAKEAFDKGEYLESIGKGGLATLSALGAIPGLGLGIRAIKGGAKAATKIDEIGEGLSSIFLNIPKVSKADEGKNIKEVLGIKTDDILNWREINKGTGYKEVGKDKLDKLQKSVQDKVDNKIGIAEHISNVEKLKPIRRWDTVPETPTFEEIAFSLNPQKGKLFKDKTFKETDTGSILYKNKNIEDGVLTTSRLDIPSYEQFDKWIVTLGPKGSNNVYAKTGYFKGGQGGKVQFNPSTKRATKTGTGKSTKEPFGLIRGGWLNHNPEELQKQATKLLDDPNWIQVGYDPRRHGVFYTREAKEGIPKLSVVEDAEEVIQIGPLVLAKKPTVRKFKVGEYKEGGSLLPILEKNIGGQVSDGLDNLYMNNRNSKHKLDNMLGFKERQYGGGLDDAYMNRRRSSAFAAPDATSAFASPMSMGGLPTIYREGGGTTVPKERMINNQPHQLSYINPQEAGLLQALGGSGRKVDGIPSYYDVDDFDQEDADAGAASLDLAGNYTGGIDGDGSYVTIGDVTKTQPAAASQAASKEADLTNLRNVPSLGSRQYHRNLLRNEGYEPWQTAYLNSLLTDYNMPTAENIVAAAMATPGGAADMKSSFNDGYRFGGPTGTIRDILEKGANRQSNIQSFMANREKKEAKEGIENLIDRASDMSSVTRNMTSENITRLNDMLSERKGGTFTPNNPVASFLVGAAAPLFGKAAITAFGGEKTVGTLTTRDGLSYQVGDRGGLTLNMPEPDIDYGNDPKITEEEVVTEKTPEEVKKESSMDKNRELKKKRRVDPNVKIIMDIYNMTEDEANRFLGNEGVGTGGVGEFEGI